MSSRLGGIERAQIRRTTLEPGRSEAATEAPAPTFDEFAARLSDAKRRRRIADSSGFLQEALLDFVTPTISDPAILRADRRLSILESLLSDVLPQLEDGDGARSLAIEVVRDEVSRQRHLLAQLQQGIAA